jgi:flagellar motor switch protein FliN/FliY
MSDIDTDTKVPLPNLDGSSPTMSDVEAYQIGDESSARVASDLEAVFDVPVQISAVLGRSHLNVGELLKLGPGSVLELDRKVGEAIDIYINNRLVARGEVVLVEEKLGVTMTEIIKAEQN